ncbi:hypothetical protein IH992_28005 [Candidatus Poribacteria bacterium]|nr:hypothetical protein [Candidatus Poribacteria bacterium]
MRRLVIIPSLLLFMLACADRNTSEGVAEDFVYVYYKHADQAAALSLSALLAAEKLKDEIELVRTVRNPGEKLEQLPPIEYEMVGKKSQENENQVFFRYRLTVKNGGTTISLRNVVIHTELIDGCWKVINFDEYSD